MSRIAPGRKLVEFWHDCRATAAAELALVLPGIAFIALNITDLGLYIYSKMQVDLAAQEAAGAARASCVDSTKLPATIHCPDLQATMTTAAQTATTLASGVSVTWPATEKYYCANAAGHLVEVATAAEPPPADCSSVYATSTASPPGDYIQVTVSYPFSSVFPGASVAQLLPQTITRTAWMRLQ